MSKYIAHKAIEVSKCIKSVRERLSQPGYLEANFLAQPKHDGVSCIIVWRGVGAGGILPDCEIFSRTGEVVKSLDHIEKYLAFIGAQPGVYLTECWAPNTPFAEISGIFRRQYSNAESVKLGCVIFDYLTLAEWNNGYSDVGYVERVERLSDNILNQAVVIGSPFKPIRGYGKLAEHWPDYTAQTLANELVAQGGYDGAIFRDPSGTWQSDNNGASGEIIKVKPLLRVTCRVVGYELGKGKHEGRIGTLLIEYKGKTQGAGTGLKDSERVIADYEHRWENRYVEIEALGETEDGFLREPRLKGIRTDVVEPD